MPIPQVCQLHTELVQLMVAQCEHFKLLIVTVHGHLFLPRVKGFAGTVDSLGGVEFDLKKNEFYF